MTKLESQNAAQVVVIGSTNLDRTAYVDSFPAAGETRLVGSFEESMGGKGANQAVAAGVLGADVLFLTALGDDPEGGLLADQLAGHGVQILPIVPPDGLTTGVAMITVDAHGENQILVSPGANFGHSSAGTRAALEAAAAWATSARAVVVTQAEIPIETIRSAAEFAVDRGLRFMLNLAPYTDLPEDVIAAADPLVVNWGEATALARSRGGLDDDVSAEQLCRAVVQNCCRSAVVTLGSRGAAALSGDTYSEVRPPKVQAVVDTTGAGDAFVGALAASLASGHPLDVALRVATDFAADTVTRKGASSSYRSTASQVPAGSESIVTMGT